MTTPLTQDLAETQARIETLAQREVVRDELRQRKSDLNEEAATLRGQNERLVPEVEPFKARIALLESSTEPVCPTCGQPLTPEHRRQVVAELNAEIETRRHLFRDNKARLEAIKPEVARRR